MVLLVQNSSSSSITPSASATLFVRILPWKEITLSTDKASGLRSSEYLSSTSQWQPWECKGSQQSLRSIYHLPIFLWSLLTEMPCAQLAGRQAEWFWEHPDCLVSHCWCTPMQEQMLQHAAFCMLCDKPSIQVSLMPCSKSNMGIPRALSSLQSRNFSIPC